MVHLDGDLERHSYLRLLFPPHSNGEVPASYAGGGVKGHRMGGANGPSGADSRATSPDDGGGIFRARQLSPRRSSCNRSEARAAQAGSAFAAAVARKRSKAAIAARRLSSFALI